MDKPKSEALEVICKLLEGLSHHELHWLQLHGIRAVQQQKRSVWPSPANSGKGDK